MKHLTIGACAECLSPIQTEYSWESPPFARENPTMGDSNVAQVLGRHWYEEHSHRHKHDFVVARHWVGENLCILLIARPVTLRHSRRQDGVIENVTTHDFRAREWALSMIEVCEHEDGIE